MRRETPDPMDVKQFQEAVDHRLSGLREDPFLAKRIIANEGKERKMKKKISVGLALALSLLFIFSAALAENWQTVTEFMSTVGSYPDLVTNGPEHQELTKDNKIISRHVVERVYAPVQVTVLNEAGEESASFQLDAQVAQVEYLYTLTYSETNENWTDKQGTETPVIAAAAVPSGEELPFAPYLFTGSRIIDISVSYAFDGSRYKKTYNGTYELAYWSDVTLNHQGQIVGKKGETVTRKFGLVDDNGKLPEHCCEVQPVEEPLPTLSPLEQSSVTVSPMVMSSPTLMPITIAEETLPPEMYGELLGPTWEPPEPTVMPTLYSAEPPALQYGDTRVSAKAVIQIFGLPCTIHYFDPDGNPMESVEEHCTNMQAFFSRDLFEELPEFGQKDGPVEVDSLRFLALLENGAGEGIILRMMEMPDVSVYYRKNDYTVRITGGKLRIKYPTDIYYSQDATHVRDEMTWEFAPDMEFITKIDYALADYPYNFTFRVENPLTLNTVSKFGKGLPIVHHYIEPDGTIREWDWQWTDDAFDVSLDTAEMTRRVDLSKGEQTLEYQDQFLSFNCILPDAKAAFVVAEKPDCVVTPQSKGYVAHITGGLLRIYYDKDIWRQEMEDGSVMNISALKEGTRTSIEIPFDFTFTVPVYGETLEE